MKTMVEMTNDLLNEIDELMNFMMKQVGGMESIKDMDDESLLVVKKLLNLMDASKEYTLAMATKLDKIDEIDAKLDKLLSK